MSNKYYKQQRYHSDDSRQTWVADDVYQKGALIEKDSILCSPFAYKWIAYYSSGSSRLGAYNGSMTIGAEEVPYNIGSEVVLSVIINNCVNAIGDRAFSEYRSLESVTIPDSVKRIEQLAFEGCYSLSSVDIPNGVARFGQQAFYKCSGLTSIDIPSGVTSIGSQAFYQCESLTSITVEATTPPTLSSGVFNRTNDCPIYVPAASLSAYQSANRWSDYASRIVAIP